MRVPTYLRRVAATVAAAAFTLVALAAVPTAIVQADAAQQPIQESDNDWN